MAKNIDKRSHLRLTIGMLRRYTPMRQTVSTIPIETQHSLFTQKPGNPGM
jgi:hypothetical protein